MPANTHRRNNGQYNHQQGRHGRRKRPQQQNKSRQQQDRHHRHGQTAHTYQCADAGQCTHNNKKSRQAALKVPQKNRKKHHHQQKTQRYQALHITHGRFREGIVHHYHAGQSDFHLRVGRTNFIRHFACSGHHLWYLGHFALTRKLDSHVDCGHFTAG